jgi:hypothetical protein
VTSGSARYTGDVAKGVVSLSEQLIADTYEENIDERAWTMQEDLLSLRLLRFGSEQTTWRCVNYWQATGIDGGGCPTFSETNPAFVVDDPYRKAEVQSKMSAFSLLGGSCVMAEWSYTVSKCTRRKLTNPTYRLPACAALPENFADVMGLDTSDYFLSARHLSSHSTCKLDEKVKCCIVVVLATRAGVHEAANLRALVSWPIGGLRACLVVGAS